MNETLQKANRKQWGTLKQCWIGDGDSDTDTHSDIVLSLHFHLITYTYLQSGLLSSRSNWKLSGCIKLKIFQDFDIVQVPS